MLELLLKLLEVAKSLVKYLKSPIEIKVIETSRFFREEQDKTFFAIKLWLFNRREVAKVINKYRFQALEPKDLNLSDSQFYVSGRRVNLERSPLPLSNYTKAELLNTSIPLRIGSGEDTLKTLFIKVEQQLEESTPVKVEIILTDIDGKNYKVKTIC